MKVDVRVREVQSNIVGERVAMGIDQGAVQHIMSILTDLYSDPELAVIREYSTNAFDAHVEAGIKRPIEVQMPTPLSPFVKIRDYGAGMDIDDIRDIYSRYGASTKRQSNEVVGMLGLGCKSALTYTDQFTLTGIKDGVMTQVSISRDEDGSGSMTVLSSQPTDMEQGVEIIVPAKTGNAFESKAQEFFSFWDKGTVLLNGKPPQRVTGLEVTPDLMLAEGVRQPVVVMGNVAYPIPREGFGYSNSAYRSNLVAFVPIGTVNFTPSREALMMTPKTKAALIEIGKKLLAELAASVQREVDESKTPWEAATRGHQAILLTGLQHSNTVLKFKDQVIPKHLQGVVAHKASANNQHLYSGDEGDVIIAESIERYRGKNWTRDWRVSTVAATKAIVFYGFTYKTITKVMREKLQLWADKKGLTLPSQFICVDKIPPDFRQWLDPKSMISWDEVSEMEIPKDPNAPKGVKVAGSYEYQTESMGYMTLMNADTIDTSQPLYWQSKWSSYISQVKAQHPTGKWTLVSLPENRVEKFKRLFPMAIDISRMAKGNAEKWVSSLTHEQKLALTMRIRSVGDNLRSMKLDASKVDDPLLSKAIKEVASVASETLYQQYQSHFVHLDAATQGGAFVEWKCEVLKNYPLLASFGRYYGGNVEREHIILYVNAAYAAKKGASS